MGFALIRLAERGIYSIPLILLASALAAVLTALAAPASAEELPRAAALPATASVRDVEPLAGAIDRVLRADLDRLQVVNTAGTPALALAELQLAVGCVGETPACLAAVAQQLEVDILILTSLDRAGDETVLTVSIFDKRKDQNIRRGVRRASGGKTESELLASIDGLLRELFGLPPAPVKPIAEIAPKEKTLPMPALIVGGAGGVALIAGGIFGAMSNGTESDFVNAPKNTRADVDAAIAIRDRAESQATTGNVLIGVGVAAIVAGAVLYFFPSAEKAHEEEIPTLAAGPFFNGPIGGAQ